MMAGTSLGSIEAVRHPALTRMIFVLAIFSLFIIFGGFRNSLAGFDYTTGLSAQTSPIHTVLLSLSFAFGALLVAFKPIECLRVSVRSLLVYILPLFAIFSYFWSVDQALTVSRALILCAVYISCLGVVCFFGYADVIKIFAWLGLSITLLSIATAVFAPSIGVHQANDAVQFVHAGRWRGVFSHRTALGQFSALFVVFVVCYRDRFSNLMRAALICPAVLCLVKAESAGAFLTCVLGILVVVSLRLVRRFGVGAFALSLIVLLLMTVTMVVFDAQVESIFLRLIGKGEDFSGRTEIWRLIPQYVESKHWLGLGYEAGFQHISDSGALNRFYIKPPNAQSAYYDMYIAFGALGLASILLSWVLLIVIFFSRAFGGIARLNFERDSGIDDPLFGIALLLILMQMCFGESFYMESNNFLTATVALMLPALLSRSAVK